MARIIYRDAATGHFAKKEDGILAESIGDASIYKQLLGTQTQVDKIDFGYEDDFSYLDIYDTDVESPV